MSNPTQTVLITSANRGLGFEFAKQYAAKGWAVVAACRNPDAAHELQALSRESTSMRLVGMDVTDASSIRAAAATLDSAPLDLLLNTAGVMGSKRQSFGNIDYESWAQVLDINTFGPVRVLEAFLPNLLAGSRKLAVSITSGMGSLSDNTSGGYIAYRSSKAALNMAMRTVALELQAQGVTCVVINPGWVRTDMGGPRAPLSPQESIAAQIRTIESIQPSANGHFLDYDGREYPW